MNKQRGICGSIDLVALTSSFIGFISLIISAETMFDSSLRISLARN